MVLVQSPAQHDRPPADHTTRIASTHGGSSGTPSPDLTDSSSSPLNSPTSTAASSKLRLETDSRQSSEQSVRDGPASPRSASIFAKIRRSTMGEVDSPAAASPISPSSPVSSARPRGLSTDSSSRRPSFTNRPSLFSMRTGRSNSTAAPPVSNEMAVRMRTLPRLLSYSAQQPPLPGSTPATPPPRPPLHLRLSSVTRTPQPADEPAPPAWTPSPVRGEPGSPDTASASRQLPNLGQPPQLVDSEVDTQEETEDDEDGSGGSARASSDEGEYRDAVSSPHNSPIPAPPLIPLSARMTPGRSALGLGGTVASNLPGWTSFDSATPTPMVAASPGQVDGSSYFDIPTRAGPAVTPRPIVNTRPSMTSRRSRSLVNLHEAAAPTHVPGPSSPVLEVLSTPTGSPRPNGMPRSRSRSLADLRAPPQYVPPPPGFEPLRSRIVPRDTEGRERLPGYSCAVHIEGRMPRKMEFTSPGVQAPNRTWHDQYIVIHGTSVRIYKDDPAVYPVDESRGSSRRNSLQSGDSTPSLHKSASNSRLGRLAAASRSSLDLMGMRSRGGSVSQADLARSTASSRLSQSVTSSSLYSGDESDGEELDGAVLSAHVHHREDKPESTKKRIRGMTKNSLVRHYTLQGAESGLAADYVKRKHVVRVRAEGEQFLLQTTGDAQVVAWIEALQAATNIALDLDVRPLPKLITLPRRRRRRRNPDGSPMTPAQLAEAAAAAQRDRIPNRGSAGGAETTIDGPASDRFERMLVEEQRANA